MVSGNEIVYIYVYVFHFQLQNIECDKEKSLKSISV